MALLNSFSNQYIECGCDEAGRGCLAGPVFAAAVVFPKDYRNEKLNDSKQLSANQREALRREIEDAALAWAVASISAEEIDKTNILKASLHAMNLAVECVAHGAKNNIESSKGNCQPELLLIDGNRFYNETEIPYQCIVKGDGKYLAIAAASILAKTHRDQLMLELDHEYPQYGWKQNKGYPTKSHYAAISQFGITRWHRKSYKLTQTDDNVCDK